MRVAINHAPVRRQGGLLGAGADGGFWSGFWSFALLAVVAGGGFLVGKSRR